ncbi:hypothetical protein ACRAWD_19580 [Caulobacter segnis]
MNMQLGLAGRHARFGLLELVVHPCNRASPTFLQDIRAFVERQKLFGVVLPPSVSEDERVIAAAERDRPFVHPHRLGRSWTSPSTLIAVGHDRAMDARPGLRGTSSGRAWQASPSSRDPTPSGRRTSMLPRGCEDGLAEAGAEAGREGHRVQGAYTFSVRREASRRRRPRSKRGHRVRRPSSAATTKWPRAFCSRRARPGYWVRQEICPSRRLR